MEQAPTSSIGRFFKGFVASAGSSTLMMGIFYGLQAGFAAMGLTAPFVLSAVLPSAITVIAAVAIFGGVMAVMRGDNHGHGSTGHSHTREAQQAVLMANTPALAQHQAVTPADLAAADALDAPAHAATRWTDRPDIAQSNRASVAQILADGKSSKDHAAAILAAQQTGNATSR